MAMVNVTYKLINLDTSKGEGYEKVEALLQGVNKAHAILKAVEAEAELLNNASLVASGQERWHQDRTAPEFVMCQKMLGVKFMAWLERQGEAANSARLTQQALSLARRATAPNTGKRCGWWGKVVTRQRTAQGEKEGGST